MKSTIYVPAVELAEWVPQEFPLLDGMYFQKCGCYAQDSLTAHFSVGHTSARHNRWVDGENKGTVCFWKEWPWDAEYPTKIFLHEYAHLKAGIRVGKTGRNQIHDKVWRDTFQELLREWGYPDVVKRSWDAIWPDNWRELA